MGRYAVGMRQACRCVRMTRSMYYYRSRMDPQTALRHQRIAVGDASAVKECISAYGGLVRSLARRLTRTHSDAEDATQEIFICIWRQAAAFDATKGSEVSFIAIIARRRWIDRCRN